MDIVKVLKGLLAGFWLPGFQTLYILASTAITACFNHLSSAANGG